MKKIGNHEDYANEGFVALKAGVLLSVISFIVLVGTHMPMSDEATVLTQATASNSTAAQSAPDGSASYTYFPSQYELHAPDASEQPSTF